MLNISSTEIPKVSANALCFITLPSVDLMFCLLILSISSPWVFTSPVSAALLKVSKFKFLPNNNSAFISFSIEDWKSSVDSEADWTWDSDNPNLEAWNAAWANTLGLFPKLLFAWADALTNLSITSLTFNTCPWVAFNSAVIDCIWATESSRGWFIKVEILNNLAAFSWERPYIWVMSCSVPSWSWFNSIAVPVRSLMDFICSNASAKFIKKLDVAAWLRLFLTLTTSLDIPKKFLPTSAALPANSPASFTSAINPFAIAPSNFPNIPKITKGSDSASPIPDANPFTPVNATLSLLPDFAASLMSSAIPEKWSADIPTLPNRPVTALTAAPERPIALFIFCSSLSLSFAFSTNFSWTLNSPCILFNNSSSSAVIVFKTSFLFSNSAFNSPRRANSNLACLTKLLTSLPRISATPIASSASFWERFLVLFKPELYCCWEDATLPISCKLALIIAFKSPAFELASSKADLYVTAYSDSSFVALARDSAEALSKSIFNDSSPNCSLKSLTSLSNFLTRKSSLSSMFVI